MTHEGHVLERKTMIRVGQNVPAIGRRVPPAMIESRERFAACVAHELRGPIALQRTLVEVTLADPDADAATLREMGARVLAGCEQQQRLIEALLDLVRSGGGLRRQEPVDLAAVTLEALRAHDPGELERVVLLEPAWTNGDPYLVARLVANLVPNAIRHNPGMGINPNSPAFQSAQTTWACQADLPGKAKMAQGFGPGRSGGGKTSSSGGGG